jgi:CDP-diacylglycerol--serine O-phosphatidyltransferase
LIRRPRVRLPRPRRLPGRWRRKPGPWLANLLTLGNLLCGYSAILAAAENRVHWAAWLILAAGLFDFLDGRVARMTSSSSEMGQQLDSLADAVSFAVAPSMFAFHLALSPLGRIGYAVCFLYAACGVIRLARFNVLPTDHEHFVGLPIPMAAAALLTPALAMQGVPLERDVSPYYAVGVTAIALLMVSRIRYRSFKELRFALRPHQVLALVALFIAGMVAKAEWVLPALIGLYLVSPPLFWLVGRWRPSAPRETPRRRWWTGRPREVEDEDLLD